MLSISVREDGGFELPPGYGLEQVSVIHTFAGTGRPGFGGNRGPALEARFQFPAGVAVDAAGDVYVTDFQNNRVCKIDTSTGRFTTIAGTGELGFSGDGQRATAARLGWPWAVALDSSGNVYVGTLYDHRVRRISAATGVIRTIAGNGFARYRGDGGPASAALLNGPNGLAVNAAGDVYVADTNNHAVRRIDASTGVITTLAGDGFPGYRGDGWPASVAQFFNPIGVAVDTAGNVLVADSSNSRVRRIDAITGVITTLAGTGERGYSGDGGPATEARLSQLGGVDVDRFGNVYVADWANNRVRRIDASTGVITTLAGTGVNGYSGDGGPASAARLASPQDVAVDSAGNVYVADSENDRIRVVRSTLGMTIPLGASGESATVRVLEDGTLESLSADPAPVLHGTLFTASNGSVYTLTKFSLPGGGSVLLTRDESGTWWHGTNVAMDGYRYVRSDREYFLRGSGGSWRFVTSFSTDRALAIPISGYGQFEVSPEYQLGRTAVIETLAGTGRHGSSGDGGPASAALFTEPRGVAVDTVGNVYVADRSSHRVRRIDATTRVITTLAGTGVNGFRGDGGPASAAWLHHPTGVAVDAAGNVYVADSGNRRIRRIDPSTGIITTVAGTGGDHTGYSGEGGPASAARIGFPEDVAVDAAGNVHMLDHANAQVRRVDAATGVITTLAGTGVHGYGGDGGRARAARFDRPRGLTVDATGNIYVADTGNRRIRRIDAATGVITTLAGTGVPAYGGDGGPAAAARLREPYDVALDAAGNIYVADAGDSRVRRIDAVTGVITTLAGTGEEGFGGDGGAAPDARLRGPVTVAADSAGTVYVGELWNRRIRVVRQFGTIDVPLGTSGETLTLGVLGDGTVFWPLPDGTPVRDGTRFSTTNGNEYALTRGPGFGLVVTYVEQRQSVSLAGGGSVLLTKDESGTWRLGTNVVMAGYRYVRGDREFILRRADGRWRFVPSFSTDGALSIPVSWAGGVDLPPGYELDRTAVIDTLAGTGVYGSGGDGGPASEASFISPTGVAVDIEGNVYVADRSSHRVRRLDASTGLITTLAGSGVSGFGGDGGPASAARLFYPIGVAVDTAGNVYVADSLNLRIRRIDGSTGIITTLAGTGVNHTAYSGEGGPALAASIGVPGDVAVDGAGNVYMVDKSNHQVRRIDIVTGVITTVAGIGEHGYGGDRGPATAARLGQPKGLAVDTAGNIYVADTENNRIRRIDASTGVITTVAGTGARGYGGDGGPAWTARLSHPQDVAVDGAGNVYIGDGTNARIRRIDAATGVITTLAGTGEQGYGGDGGPASDAQFWGPNTVAVDAAGNVYVGDGVNRRIRVIRQVVTLAVPLGASGESLMLRVLENGTLAWLFQDGAPVRDGERFSAANGNMYALRKRQGGGVVAEHVERSQSVSLAGGGSVLLTRDASGTWRIGTDVVMDGYRYVLGDREHILRGGDGSWRFVTSFSTDRALAIPISGYGRFETGPGYELHQTAVIETLAGTGEYSSGGDGGPASAASFTEPRGVAVDAVGNLYVADRASHRIRRIDASTGLVTTLAGIGEEGYGGDGGPASAAWLSRPAGVAVDAAGNVYVADSGNLRIRRIDPSTGVITTLAGTGVSGFGGDGIPASAARIGIPEDVAVDAAGNVYMIDEYNDQVRRIDIVTGVINTVAGTGVAGYKGDGGPATAAQFRQPNGLTVDVAGNIYVADTVNNRIRRIDAATGVITTLAGTGERGYGGDGGPAKAARLSHPQDVAVDAAGNVYIGDSANARVRRIDAATGVITTLAGTGERGYGGDGGPASEAQLREPLTVAVDAAGTVYVGDVVNRRVRVVRQRVTVSFALGTSGETLTLGVSEEGTLAWPSRDGAPVPDGKRFSAANGNEYALTKGADGGVVTKYVEQSQSVSLLGGGSVLLRRDESGTWRIGNDAVTDGYRYVRGNSEYILRRTGRNWMFLLSSGELFIPVREGGGFEVPPEYKLERNVLIETVAGTRRGGFGGDGGPAAEAQLWNVRGVALDTAGNLYVADSGNGRIRRIDASTGVITTLAGSDERGYGGDGGPAAEAQLNFPEAVAVDAAGNLYVADSNNHRVRRIDASTGVITTLAGTGEPGFSGDGGPAATAQLNFPRGLALDAAGNLYVADPGNNRIRRIDTATRMITTVAGSEERGATGDGGPALDAGLGVSDDVAVDTAGNLYIADGTSRIRRVDASTGVITTLAGSNRQGFGGDGGPATAAELYHPEGVAVDAAGNVYVADRANRRIRRIDASTGVITTLAGTGESGNSGDGGPAADARVRSPQGMAVDAAGNVYVADALEVRVVRQVVNLTVPLGGSGDRLTLRVMLDGTLVALGNGRVPVADGDQFTADNGHVYALAAGPTGGILVKGVPQTRAVALPGGGSVLLATDASGTWRIGSEPVRDGYRYVSEGREYFLRGNGVSWRFVATSSAEGVLSIPFSDNGEFRIPAEYELERTMVIDKFPDRTAPLRGSQGIAVDTAGNVYTSDEDGHRISKFDATTGMITTLAGTGEQGYGGDGGPAAEAQLDSPGGIAVDTVGNVYVADSGNHRIRRIDASTGVITTLAGSGEPGYRGDGGPASEAQLGDLAGLAVDAAGNVYVGDSARIRRIKASTGVIATLTVSEGFGGETQDAYFFQLAGIAVDVAGNLYIAERGAHRIRRFDASTGAIATLTVSEGFGGEAQEAYFSFPEAIAVDVAGNVYVAEFGEYRIRWFDASTGTIMTLAGTDKPGAGGDGGPASEAQLSSLGGLAVDATGNVYVVALGEVRVIRLVSKIAVPLGASGDRRKLRVLENGALATLSRVSVPVRDGDRFTACNGTIYALSSGPGGEVVSTYVPQTQAIALPGGGSVVLSRDEGGMWKIGSDPVTDGYRFVRQGDAHILERVGGTWTFLPATPADGSLSLSIGEDGKFELHPGSELKTITVSDTVFVGAYRLAVDSAGSLYVGGRRQVFRIDSSTGEIETLAGTGERWYRGDGGPASEASFTGIAGLAVDAAGNVFVADRDLSIRRDGRVRRIDASTGIVSTLDGTQISGALAVDAAGNVYLVSGNVVRKIDAATGERETLGEFDEAGALAIDGACNVYVADTANHRIRKIDARTAEITTLAGTGQQGFGGDGGPASGSLLDTPEGLAVDADGNVYVADTANHRIRKIDARTAEITTLAGTGQRGFGGDGGPASRALFDSPDELATDAVGNVYVTDQENDRVRGLRTVLQLTVPLGASGESVAFRVLRNGAVVSLSRDGAQVLDGDRLTARNGSEYVITRGPRGNGVVATFQPQTQRVALAGMESVLLEREENGIWRIGSDAVADGYRYVKGEEEYILERTDGGWSFVSARDVLSIPVNANGGFEPLPGLDVHATLVIDTLAGMEEDGYGGDGGPASEAQLSAGGVAVDAAGNLYLADTGNHRIRKIDASTGVITTLAGTGELGNGGDGGLASEALLGSPRSVAVDAAGNLYLADTGNHRIRKIDASTGVITTLAGTGEYGYGGDGGLATEALLGYPHSMALDAAGNLYVVAGDAVRRIDSSTGVITTLAGTGVQGFDGDGGSASAARLNNPGGVAVDIAGNVYVADTRNHRIRKIDASTGVITTLAGTGVRGFGGDGGSASQAWLFEPNGVAVDAAGHVYVSDYWNQRIRRIDASTGVITTLAGTGEHASDGDGGPAAEAALRFPSSLAVDMAGSIYVMSWDGGGRVRVIRSENLINVPLGTSGESVPLLVSEDGRLRKDGRLVTNGSRVMAGNGDVYALTKREDGTLAADYLEHMQSVELPYGAFLLLARDEDGAWRIGSTPIENGYVHTQDGRNHVLELAGGTWRAARFVIRTVAGNTTVSDGIPATDSTLFRPCSVGVDGIGNVYVADSGNDRIRQIGLTGIISTLAGTGDWGYSGDGGPAADAQIASPCYVAADVSGNVYVTDTSHHRVRRIDASTGVITTLAGTGVQGFGGDGGPAAAARLNAPMGVAVDTTGNIYIADTSNRRVRRIDASTRVITTLAGTGLSARHEQVIAEGPAAEALFNSPVGVAVDAMGNVYVADRLNDSVRKIDASTGMIAIFAGGIGGGFSGDGGPATEARLSYPIGVSADAAGNVYVADTHNHRIRKIDTFGTITSLAGSGDYWRAGYGGDGGPASSARLSAPSGVAVDATGNVYVADTGNHRVRRIDGSTGVITSFAGTGDWSGGWDGGAAEQAKFFGPSGLAVDSSGSLYFIDEYRVWKLDPSGVISSLAGTGEPGFSLPDGPAAEARFSDPRGVAVDAAGNVYVTDGSHGRIYKIDPKMGLISVVAGGGSELGDGVPASEARLNLPSGLAIDAVGNLYVAVWRDHRVRKIDGSGIISTLAGTGEIGDSGDGGAAVEATLRYPRDIAVDGAGNVYVVGSGSRVRRINASSGVITTLGGSYPDAWSLAVDLEGNVYVGGGRQIHEIDTEGSVSVIAGTGEGGFGGDGEPAGGARISVGRMAVDRFGDIWFMDLNSRRIRVLQRQPVQD